MNEQLFPFVFVSVNIDIIFYFILFDLYYLYLPLCIIFRQKKFLSFVLLLFHSNTVSYLLLLYLIAGICIIWCNHRYISTFVMVAFCGHMCARGPHLYTSSIGCRISNKFIVVWMHVGKAENTWRHQKRWVPWISSILISTYCFNWANL